MTEPEKIPVEQLAPAEVGELDLYQRREKIYTRKIEGFFQRLRLYTGWPLLIGYFLVPWLNWGDRPAVLFDLPARKFYIFGFTFWPQDFPMLAWLLIIAAWSLFAVTVWLGRVWCGYTCPQTVWTAIFMWAEQVAEGSRNQRIKLDKSPWTLNKIARKVLKHGMWIGFAFLTGLTFIGYFSPIRQLVPNTFTLNASLMEGAWIIFFTCATYINAGWMREQVCLYMCPYARFQSVMFDRDTLIVSYDKARGEPRGARKKEVDPKAVGLGECIDCSICVQVCPTGIDIRDGLQYQCISCALCIDGCNSVMDKMGYPRGLIRYTTENLLEGKKYHWLRPRLLGYGIGVVVMFSLFIYTLSTRIPL
ncbi:MAG TPA: cytochrome c oxidase accessory protein CcoG, partial [Spongiibacteraceae bacterium]|nr:cytochrome c oxidase accessory protein CcoG [Spongiibacteraceae bacterium]